MNKFVIYCIGLAFALLLNNCSSIVPYSPVNINTGKTIGKDYVELKVAVLNAHTLYSKTSGNFSPDFPPQEWQPVNSLIYDSNEKYKGLGFMLGFKYGITEKIDGGLNGGLFLGWPCSFWFRAYSQFQLTNNSSVWQVSILPDIAYFAGNKIEGKDMYERRNRNNNFLYYANYQSSIGSNLITTGLTLPVSYILNKNITITLNPMIELYFYNINFDYEQNITYSDSSRQSYKYYGKYRNNYFSPGLGMNFEFKKMISFGTIVMMYKFENKYEFIPFFGFETKLNF